MITGSPGQVHIRSPGDRPYYCVTKMGIRSCCIGSALILASRGFPATLPVLLSGFGGVFLERGDPKLIVGLH